MRRADAIGSTVHPAWINGGKNKGALYVNEKAWKQSQLARLRSGLKPNVEKLERVTNSTPANDSRSRRLSAPIAECQAVVSTSAIGSTVHSASIYGGMNETALYVNEEAWKQSHLARLRSGLKLNVEKLERVANSTPANDLRSRRQSAAIAEYQAVASTLWLALVPDDADDELTSAYRAECAERSARALPILLAAANRYRDRYDGGADERIVTTYAFRDAAAVVLRAGAAYVGIERPSARALCGTAVKGQGGVTLTRLANQTPLVSGIAHCNSPYTCTVCAIRRRTKEDKELIPTVLRHVKHGGGLYMLTLTTASISDGGDWTLPREHVKKIKMAIKRLRDTAAWASLKAQGYVGQVAAWHFKHNRHAGHNFHQHALLFHDEVLAPDIFARIVADLKRAWADCCQRVGLVADANIGLDLQTVRNPAKAARYLTANEGLDEALTGQPDLTTAWGLLDLARRSLEGGWWELPHAVEAIDAWFAYATATAGLDWIRWSPGLRERIGPAETVTEEMYRLALVESPEYVPAEVDAPPPPPAEAETVTISQEDWTMLCHRRAVPAILAAMQSYGADGVLSLLHWLKDERWPALPPPAYLDAVPRVRMTPAPPSSN